MSLNVLLVTMVMLLISFVALFESVNGDIVWTCVTIYSADPSANGDQFWTWLWDNSGACIDNFFGGCDDYAEPYVHFYNPGTAEMASTEQKTVTNKFEKVTFGTDDKGKQLCVKHDNGNNIDDLTIALKDCDSLGCPTLTSDVLTSFELQKGLSCNTKYNTGGITYSISCDYYNY